MGVIFSVFHYNSLHHSMAFYGLPGIALSGVPAFSSKIHCICSPKPDTQQLTRYSIAIGIAVVGAVLLAIGYILYTLIGLFKGKMNYRK
jgi:hypothetical protein